MRRELRSGLLAGVLGSVVVVAGCAGMRHPTSVTVPLVLRPTEVPNAAVSMPHGQGRVHVAAVQDGRAEREKIGENRENSPPVPILADSSPTEFVRAALVEQLKNSGVKVAEGSDAADFTLAVTLTRFWAEESPNYDAQVMLAAEVRTRGGAAVWSGTASGHDGTFGRSLSAENYQQVLSNALVNAIASLTAKPQFQEALIPREPQPRPRRAR